MWKADCAKAERPQDICDWKICSWPLKMTSDTEKKVAKKFMVQFRSYFTILTRFYKNKKIYNN